MMLSHDAYYKEHKVWDKAHVIPTFSLVLSSSAAADGKKHVDHYIHKRLLTRLDGLKALADWMGQDAGVLRNTLLQYRADASNGSDQWGKSSFQGTPIEDLDNELISISMGVSNCIDNNVKSAEELVKISDEAMYQSKSNGKGQVSQT